MRPTLTTEATFTPQSTIAGGYCVVEYSTATGVSPPKVALLVVDRLCNIWSMNEANRNSVWRSVSAASDVVAIGTRVLCVGEMLECKRWLDAHLSSLGPNLPVGNAYGILSSPREQGIRCSNGQTYRNQTEAAAALGCAQGVISQIVNGKLSSWRGLRFWRT